jgi:antitoxin CcdA
MIKIYYITKRYDNIYDKGGVLMTNRATFTLEKETFEFLKKVGGSNRSAYINQLLKKEKQQLLQKAILKANREEAEDSAYQDELSDWDSTLSDGLDS